jgi:hypothetical protein
MLSLGSKVQSRRRVGREKHGPNGQLDTVACRRNQRKPLFVERVVRALSDRAFVQPHVDQWVVTIEAPSRRVWRSGAAPAGAWRYGD